MKHLCVKEENEQEIGKKKRKRWINDDGNMVRLRRRLGGERIVTREKKGNDGVGSGGVGIATRGSGRVEGWSEYSEPTMGRKVRI